MVGQIDCECQTNPYLWRRLSVAWMNGYALVGRSHSRYPHPSIHILYFARVL